MLLLTWTKLLPRLIGLPKATEVMVFSKPMMFEEGEKLGLIDAIVPSKDLLNVARKWALDIAKKRKPWI
ncbi:hypothetical protein Leryth_019678 [Lithospermum erythrorhizon]|nr:hypothetical protein Leryth_019678 [Lithospermum erythrorhizon]